MFRGQTGAAHHFHKYLHARIAQSSSRGRGHGQISQARPHLLHIADNHMANIKRKPSPAAKQIPLFPKDFNDAAPDDPAPQKGDANSFFGELRHEQWTRAASDPRPLRPHAASAAMYEPKSQVATFSQQRSHDNISTTRPPRSLWEKAHYPRKNWCRLKKSRTGGKSLTH